MLKTLSSENPVNPDHTQTSTPKYTEQEILRDISIHPVGGQRWKMFVEEPRIAKGRGVGRGTGESSNYRKQERPQGTRNKINLLVAIRGDGKKKKELIKPMPPFLLH